MRSLYLGADIGTTSAKCLAVSEDGRILAAAQQPYPLSHPRQDWAEQDAQDYWRGLVTVVTQCVQACRDQGRPPADIAALALSTQGDTLIVTDEAGNALAPAMTWMDSRAQAQHRRLLAETGASFWYRETGARLARLSSACKIRWIAETAPKLKSRIRRFCWVSDFLAHRLCGRFVADVPSASWTPLYSPVKRRWSADVMRVLEVPPESLPQVVESGAPIGPLLPEAAAALQLTPQVMLAAGAFDQAAAAHGAGAKPAGTSVLSCGTAWVVYAVTDTPVVDEREQIPICCHTSPGTWGMVLPFTGGAAYDWFHRTFERGASQATSGARQPVFIPHLYGGLAPDWREESQGSLLGLNIAHTWDDVRTAVMRGLACEARRNVEAAERMCGRIPSLRLVGGAGKSESWPQLIADVLDRRVEVSPYAEAACYGAAKLAAGAAASEWDRAQGAREFAPRPERTETEHRAYARYLRFYEALLPVYSEAMPAGDTAD